MPDLPDLEHDLRSLFEHDADDVDPAARRRLLDGPGAVRQRRRPGLYVAIVAAVVVLFAGVASVGHARHEPTRPAGPVVTDEATTQVGFHGVGVTVPTTWVDHVPYDCPTPVGALYVSSRAADCSGGPGRGGLAITMVEQDSRLGRIATNHVTATLGIRPDPPPIQGSYTECVDDGSVAPGHYCSLYLVAPDAGVALLISGRLTDPVAQAVIDSVALLAHGRVAVPVIARSASAVDVARKLGGLGLRAVGDTLSDVGVTSLDPAPGTVVDAGSTVTITAPAPDVDLVGTWKVSGSDTQDEEFARSSVSFADDGTFSADDGCRLLAGVYTASGASLGFDVEGASHEVPCRRDPGLRDLLGPVVATQARKDGLALLDEGGATVLTLTSRLVGTKPGPITLAGFEHAASAQEFRAYTGPTPAPFTEQQALERFGEPGAVSLGLVDLGMVHTDGHVDWTSSIVVADVVYVADVNALSLGGPRGQVAGQDPPPPPAPRPGWVRSVSVYDAVTGAFELGSSY